jgi:hypothetical protein
MIRSEVAIAAARSDDDGRARLVAMTDGIKSECRNVFVFVAEGAGCGFVPEAKGVEFGRGIDSGVGIWGGVLGVR